MDSCSLKMILFSKILNTLFNSTINFLHAKTYRKHHLQLFSGRRGKSRHVDVDLPFRQYHYTIGLYVYD